MQRYEYKILLSQDFHAPQFSEARKLFEAKLNDLGRDGWVVDKFEIDTTISALLRRPIPG